MSPIHGSCLCGSVKFEIVGPLLRPLNCHCSICRKANGAAFRSRVRVRRADFVWVQGKDLVRFHESSPGYHRGFCGVCGSPILNKADANFRLASVNPAILGEYGIALGVLDDDPGVRPEHHVFVGSKAPWLDITDDLPRHAELP